MLQRYFNSVRTSRDLRRDTPAPPITPLIVITVIALALYLTASVLLVPPNSNPAFNFVNESGSVTALSAIFLAAGAGFALASFLLGERTDRYGRMFWLALTAALGFLALDELLQFHERVGDALYELGVFGSAVDNTPLRNLNDAIVILYGLAALPAALYFLPGVIRWPRVLGLFVVAFLCYAVHTTIDSVSEPATFLSIVCEESAKLYSSCFIALATLSGLLGVAAHGRTTSDATPATQSASD